MAAAASNPAVGLVTLTLGGSEVPAVLGLDPWLSAYALGARKLGLTPEPETRPAMVNGLRLQEAHLAWLADDGYDVMPAPADGFAHPELPWLVGHPDGFVAWPLAESEGVGDRSAPASSRDATRAASGLARAPSGSASVRVPVELKLRGIAPSDDLRLRDSVQALTYAAILGSPVALVSTVHGGFGGIVRDEWTVEWDNTLWQTIVSRCLWFLEGLEGGHLPAPDGSDSARDVLRAGAAENGKAVRADKATWQHVLASRELDYTIKTAKAQKEKHDQAIQAFMGDATELVSPSDSPAARWRASERHALDTAALRRAHPDLAAEFTKTTTTRRFEVNV